MKAARSQSDKCYPRCIVATAARQEGGGEATSEPIEIQNLRELLAFGWVTKEEFERQREQAMGSAAEEHRQQEVVGAVDMHALSPEHDGDGGMVYLSNMAVCPSHRR